MQIINVLSPSIFEDCHIKGSVNVPFDSLVDYVEDLPKDTELVVHCASYLCPMSKRAWQLLKDQGFINVKAYEGGTAEWYALGFPTEGPAEQTYLNEHYDKPTTSGDVETIDAKGLHKKLVL